MPERQEVHSLRQRPSQRKAASSASASHSSLNPEAARSLATKPDNFKSY
jgi:hypothetical protein